LPFIELETSFTYYFISCFSYYNSVDGQVKESPDYLEVKMDKNRKVMLIVVAILFASAIVVFSARNILAQSSTETVAETSLKSVSTCSSGGCSTESCNCQGSCGCSANGGTCGCGGRCSAGTTCGCSAN